VSRPEDETESPSLTPRLPPRTPPYIDEMCTTINDFPNELLNEVCHGIDAEDDLIALASLCTRFHDIALSIYFGRLGLDGLSLHLGYSELSLVDHTLKVLKGIRLSLALRSGPAWLQHLTFLDFLFKRDDQATPEIYITI
jgi:hypothetical protein